MCLADTHQRLGPGEGDSANPWRKLLTLQRIPNADKADLRDSCGFAAGGSCIPPRVKKIEEGVACAL